LFNTDDDAPRTVRASLFRKTPMPPALSMAAFALASSLTPGPVNLVALSSGARHGWRASLPYVTGATVGFTALLLLVGLGLEQVTRVLPTLVAWLRWGGVAFLLLMAWRLAIDSGELAMHDASQRRPSMLAGAVMQWLNPKAWLATLSGVAVYAAGQLGLFATIYFVICLGSIAAWAVAGSTLTSTLSSPRAMRRFNAAMAALLAASAAFMLRA
jgi:threonine/homoserine/homoserine lactone efflux protein